MEARCPLLALSICSGKGSSSSHGGSWLCSTFLSLTSGSGASREEDRLAYRGLVAADACPLSLGRILSLGTGLSVTTRDCRDIRAHSFPQSDTNFGLYV